MEYTPKLGAFSFCVMKHLGMMEADGDIDREKLEEMFEKLVHDEDKVETHVKQCAEKKATSEETAFHLMRCFYTFRKEHADTQKL